MRLPFLFTYAAHSLGCSVPLLDALWHTLPFTTRCRWHWEHIAPPPGQLLPTKTAKLFPNIELGSEFITQYDPPEGWLWFIVNDHKDRVRFCVRYYREGIKYCDDAGNDMRHANLWLEEVSRCLRLVYFQRKMVLKFRRGYAKYKITLRNDVVRVLMSPDSSISYEHDGRTEYRRVVRQRDQQLTERFASKRAWMQRLLIEVRNQ